jgi:hypothetical protein
MQIRQYAKGAFRKGKLNTAEIQNKSKLVLNPSSWLITIQVPLIILILFFYPLTSPGIFFFNKLSIIHFGCFEIFF